MRDGALVDLDGGEFDVRDQAAKREEIHPAVGTELDGGTQFPGVTEHFGEKMKKGRFMLNSLISLGIGVSKIATPKILLLGLIIHVLIGSWGNRPEYRVAGGPKGCPSATRCQLKLPALELAASRKNEASWLDRKRGLAFYRVRMQRVATGWPECRGKIEKSI
jgi:hypothetical protein